MYYLALVAPDILQQFGLTDGIKHEWECKTNVNSKVHSGLGWYRNYYLMMHYAMAATFTVLEHFWKK